MAADAAGRGWLTEPREGEDGSVPTGTVTFLFTDLEGSTRLWEQHPEAMKAALARHDDILRQAIEDRGGHVVKTTGDGVHAVFGVAEAAVDAAVNAQRLLAREDWAEPRAVAGPDGPEHGFVTASAPSRPCARRPGHVATKVIGPA